MPSIFPHNLDTNRESEKLKIDREERRRRRADARGINRAIENLEQESELEEHEENQVQTDVSENLELLSRDELLQKYKMLRTDYVKVCEELYEKMKKLKHGKMRFSP